MLQNIRKNSQGTAAKVIVGLIVVTFALFGVESIVGGLSGEPEVATVNGEEIAESTFVRALEGKRRQILAQMGDRADPDLIDEGLLRASVLEGLIEEQVLSQDAEAKGLYVSDMAVDNYIRQIEQFRVDGEFSNERMQMILRNAGLTLQDYRDSLKKQFMLGQSRSALIASAFALGVENSEIVALDRQTRVFGAATVQVKDYLDAIAIGDEELKPYYDENKSSFVKAKNVDVAYVELRKQDLIDGIEVSDEDIETLYENEKDDFAGEEQRQAAHILIKIDDARSEEAALAEINAVVSRLEQGEEFATLASELSEDEGSAKSGGDLGMSPRGVYVADFEEALFALEEGAMSAPVKTEFGYHLIKLLKVEGNEVPELAELRDTLESRIKSERADQEYAELVERLADISYSSSDLEEPAEELGLKINQLAGISEVTSDIIFSNIKVQRVLFSDELIKDGNNSDVIEVEDGHSVVVRVEAFHEESIQPLDAVKEDVRAILVEAKAKEYAASVGEAFIARILGGEEPEVVSEDMGLNWKLHEGVKRNDVYVDPELLSQAFSMKYSGELKSDITGFEVGSGDYAVVMLQGVTPGNADEVTVLERRSITDMVGDSFGAGDYRNYQDIMIRDAIVERI